MHSYTQENNTQDDYRQAKPTYADALGAKGWQSMRLAGKNSAVLMSFTPN
jgi:hypothetical protein